MYSTKLTRAAHRATASSSPTAALISNSSTHHCTARPASHQRRHSSSKTSSCPPDDSATKITAKASATGEQQAPRAPKAAPKQNKGRSRGGYKRVAAAAENKKPAEPIDQFAALPSVPPIQGLRPEDLNMSKFFSLHRPVSLTTTIPPPSSAETFASIFANRQTQDPWANGNSAERRPEDVIYTLHNTIDALEKGNNNAEDEGVRWEIIHESSSNSDGVKHLDGAPQRMKSLDEIVAQFKPFKAPPPPQPFIGVKEQPAGVEKKMAVQRTSTKGRPKKKTFTATITVTESTFEDGQRTYSASSSPIVRLPEPTERTDSNRAMREPTRTRQPFLTRMAQRGRDNMAAQATSSTNTSSQMPVRNAPSPARQERIMRLISVKRQRKLKMKKHKYKKLMKRTRNLRRRQDRA
ncbi:uncharacterized protein LTR77_005048 [Saxophila tyrrhenica]|uniref:Small ribosomal subunit protein mS38 n=1 Tax=Saxophila tyrrhenica TaxID=1690608 RepID=A0AAV9PF65_9PEZI|nr:hypothetical protein LTR77_005048 [Saxophila tyrrhenica]